ESATLEQHGHDRPSRHSESNSRRQSEKQRQLEAAILRLLCPRIVAEPYLARQRGQDRRADRDANYRERQLVEPVGVIEIGNRAGREERGDRGRDDEVELRHPGTEDARQHQAQHAFHLVREARQRQREAEPRLVAGDHQPKELREARERQRPGQRFAGQRPNENQRPDEKDIEQHRRRRRRGEALDRIQNAALQRRQRDEEQIGKGDPRQPDGEREFLRMRAKPRRQYVEQPGGREFARQDEEEQRRKQDRHRILGEALGVGLAVLRDHPGKERNERGGERTLGKEAAEEIGEALRDEERVGHRPRAEEGGGQDIPDKAENP